MNSWDELFWGYGPAPRRSDQILTRKQLEELQRRLSMMSVTAVQDFYTSAHLIARIGPGRFPSGTRLDLSSPSQHGPGPYFK